MIRFSAMATDTARGFTGGAPDAFGNRPETALSGGGWPCRHCMKDIAEGEPALVLAYKPFAGHHPYSEVGPVFLCAEECERRADSAAVPAFVAHRDTALIKGYGEDDRIVYGTGKIVKTGEIVAECDDIFSNPEVAYIHVRSATNNCYSCRVDRGVA